MLKLRAKLAKYQELFYGIFMITMTAMTSMGLNSEHLIYRIVFAAVTLSLLLKMAVTDLTWREILLMAVFTVLFGAIFLKNREKILILTAMGIFGAKNVSLDRILKYAFWIKTILTIGTLTLAAAGIIENAAISLPKNGRLVDLHCYGYYHPNMAFANIFVLLLLAVLVYKDRIRWYAYVIGTGIMLAAYKVFMCRTGLIIWGVLCLMMLSYRLAVRWKKERIYTAFLAAVPAVLAALTAILTYWARKSPVADQKLNFYLSGRISHISQFAEDLGSLVFGSATREPFDSIYFHLLYNYGWVIFVLCLLVYCAGMWYCNKNNRFYATIGLSIMAVYGFMEHLPLSVLWNLPLLYLSWLLFKEKKGTDEQLQ